MAFDPHKKEESTGNESTANDTEMNNSNSKPQPNTNDKDKHEEENHDNHEHGAHCNHNHKKVDRHKVQPHAAEVVHTVSASDLEEYYYNDTKELNLLHAHLTVMPDFSHFGENFNSEENMNDTITALTVKKLVLRQNLLSSLQGIEVFKNLVELDFYLNEMEFICESDRINNKTPSDANYSTNKYHPSNEIDNHLQNQNELKMENANNNNNNNDNNDDTTMEIESKDDSNDKSDENDKMKDKKSNNNNKEICALHELKELKWLDLSFNAIREIKGLKNNLKLEKVYFVNNKIKKIENINHLTNLTMLELGSNRIRKIENIDKLINLKELWVGKNKIRELKGMDRLINLELLSIQSNRITQIGNGLANCRNLEQLYLSHNGIKKMDEGLRNLTKLKILDIAANEISKIENVDTLTELEELWLNDNKINTFDGLDQVNKNLQTIYLERNPIYLDNDRKVYQREILKKLPNLTQLDADPIVERLRANILESRMNTQ